MAVAKRMNRARNRDEKTVYAGNTVTRKFADKRTADLRRQAHHDNYLNSRFVGRFIGSRAPFQPKEIRFSFRSLGARARVCVRLCVSRCGRKGKKRLLQINRFPYDTRAVICIHSIIFRFRSDLSIFIMRFVPNASPIHPFRDYIYIRCCIDPLLQ